MSVNSTPHQTTKLRKVDSNTTLPPNQNNVPNGSYDVVSTASLSFDQYPTQGPFDRKIREVKSQSYQNSEPNDFLEAPTSRTRFVYPNTDSPLQVSQTLFSLRTFRRSSIFSLRPPCVTATTDLCSEVAFLPTTPPYQKTATLPLWTIYGVD